MVAVGVPKAQESTQVVDTYLERLKAARVSEGVLDDVVGVYARSHSANEDECEGLLEQLEEPQRKAQVRKAILDVIFSVIAASELPFDLAFHTIVDRLDVHEDESIVRDLKQSFLQRMAADVDYEGKGAISMADIQRRLAYVGQCIGIGQDEARS